MCVCVRGAVPGETAAGGGDGGVSRERPLLRRKVGEGADRGEVGGGGRVVPVETTAEERGGRALPGDTTAAGGGGRPSRERPLRGEGGG